MLSIGRNRLCIAYEAALIHHVVFHWQRFVQFQWHFKAKNTHLTLLQKNRHTDIVLATRADAVCLCKACRSVVCSRATAPAAVESEVLIFLVLVNVLVVNLPSLPLTTHIAVDPGCSHRHAIAIVTCDEEIIYTHTAEQIGQLSPDPFPLID